MGLLQTMPLIVTLTVEKGFMRALSEIAWMFLSGIFLFITFFLFLYRIDGIVCSFFVLMPFLAVV
jgi:hypothetical protein